MDAVADVGVIGGSGLYSLLDCGRELAVQTPYGAPSSPVTVAEVGGRSVAFLTRHGRHHELPPHRVNYRANAWALRSLGVSRVLAPCAVGSLQPQLGPGSLVLPDQLVDWTRGRIQSFHDAFDAGPVHAEFADPYCPAARSAAAAAAASSGWTPVVGGTMVVIDGPRFSTRAESRFFAAQGWSLVNMTGHPEAVLCRELGMCYQPVALVTDLDAGVAVGDGVSVEIVLAEFARSTDRLRSVLLEAAEHLPTGDCASCPTAVLGTAP
jgi:5'-methylthioadenosine phosphorylase